MAFSLTGQNSSQTYYQVPCTLEYGNKSWVQNCNFTSYSCKMNCTVTSCEHVPNNISFEVCGQDCSHTNSMVDQCSEQIHDGGYHTCYAAGYNLTIGKKEFASEKAYYCEGGQCNLKCNGIRCTQICKEGEDGEYKTKAGMISKINVAAFLLTDQALKSRVWGPFLLSQSETYTSKNLYI